MSEPHTADLATRYRYRQEGAEIERERIIKLLEAEGCHCTPDPEAGKCYPHNLVALIKAEQK